MKLSGYLLHLLVLFSPVLVWTAKPKKGSHYEILGLDDDKASEKEIKRAYRTMALKWHPDKHPEGEARDEATKKFQEISHAYEVLSDENSRRQYDLGGSGGGSGHGFGGDPFAGFQGRDPFEMFKDAFGTDDPFSDMIKDMMSNMMGGGFPHHGGRTSRKRNTKSSGGNPMEDMLQNMMGGMMGGMGGANSFSSFSSSSSSFGGGGVSTSTQTVIQNGQRITRTVTRAADGTETVEETINGVPTNHGPERIESSSNPRQRPQQHWGF